MHFFVAREEGRALGCGAFVMSEGRSAEMKRVFVDPAARFSFAADRSSVPADALPFDMFQFSPTWGGNIGAAKKETDHYFFGRVHVSVR